MDESEFEKLFVFLHGRLNRMQRVLRKELSGEKNPDMNDAETALDEADDRAGEEDWQEAINQLLTAAYSLGRASRNDDVDVDADGFDDELPSDDED